MQSKFLNTIEKYDMLSKEQNVVAAVSGGSDSLCMLLLLMDYYGPEYKDHIICAHYNHMIRGLESDADEALVRDICNKYNLRFVCDRGNIPAVAHDKGLGIEECARIMRYDFLQRVSKENGSIKIAVAHNKNDNVETIIGNIARGTSISGLKGISYCKNNVIRPLMDYSKEEIDLICNNAGLSVAKDSTNNDNNYKRNKIRNVILPFLRDNLSARIDDKILSLSESAIVDNSYIEEQTAVSFKQCICNRAEDFTSIIIDINVFNGFHSAIKYRIVRNCLASLYVDGQPVFPEFVNIDKKTVLRITEGIEKKQTGKCYEALCGVTCTIEYDKAVFSSVSSTEDNEYKQLESDVYKINYDDFSQFLKKKNPYVEYFDYNRLCDIFGEDFKYEYRNATEGDLFHPFGAKGSKLLRKYYIDSKMPVSRRRTNKVVCVKNQVLWIPGLRRSDIAKIDETTLYVLELRVV